MMFFNWLGRGCIASWVYIIDITCFFLQAFSIWQSHRNVFNRAVYSTLLDQLITTGVSAIVTVTFFAILVGIGVTSQLIYIMEAVTGAGDIIGILARLVLSEMGPLLVGFVLVARSCSAIVVDLGNIKVRGENEPLEYLGIDIDDYLVVPRVLAMAISQVTLAFYFTAIMILCGVFFSAYIYDFSAHKSLMELLGTITVSGVMRFVLKNVFFGLVMGGMACFHGLSVKGSPTEVPEQMQKMVVRCLMFLFMADGYFIIFTV